MRGGRAVAVAALLCGVAPGVPAEPLTPEQAAGKRLYLEGIAASGDVPRARVGAGGLELPASALPCGNCHGVDGLGRPEGGITPPDITWSELSKPYGHVHENRRRHGQFTAEGFRRAITDGVDPAGNTLDQAMPRYVFGHRDLANLQAYLERLGSERDPGLTDETVRIGSLLPSSGPFAAPGAAVRALLEAYIEAANGRGGVYGRKLELVVAEYSQRPADNIDRIRELLEGDGVFALLSPFAAGFERQLTDLARDRRLPVVAPVTLHVDDRPDANSHVFHLLSDGVQLGEVLSKYAAEFLDLASESLTLLHPAGHEGRAAAERVASLLEALGVHGAGKLAFEPGQADVSALVGKMKDDGTTAVLLLGYGLDSAALGAAADRAGWHPRLLLPGPFASSGVLGLSSGFDSKVFLAYPSLPTDRRPKSWGDFVGLLRSKQVGPGHHATLAAAYSGAALLLEGLKRSGRDLSRARLIESLEKIQDFEPGLLPTLSFNTTRRIGALGGYVVGVDLARKVYKPLGEWVRLD